MKCVKGAARKHDPSLGIPVVVEDVEQVRGRCSGLPGWTCSGEAKVGDYGGYSHYQLGEADTTIAFMENIYEATCPHY